MIAEIAHSRGIRVVWTLHDTKLVCPCYTCTRNGKWCEECFTDKKAVIRHKCMPGNIPGAIIGWREILKWNKDRLQACTDKFLLPSGKCGATVPVEQSHPTNGQEKLYNGIARRGSVKGLSQNSLFL